MYPALTTASAALALSLAGSANAAIDVHVTGSDWGIWVTGLFSSLDNPGGSTHYALMDNGSGIPMDFMMTLPDGTAFDGSDVTMRMVSADIDGDIGDASLAVTDWSLWIGGQDWGLHVIWSSSTGPLALENLGSSGQDGVDVFHYESSGWSDTLQWTYDRADGTSETFTTTVDSFAFSAPIPTPASASLLAVAGLTAARRRR